MTNAPFKGALQSLAESCSLFHDPYITVRLPFRQASCMPKCFEAVKPPFMPHIHQAKAFERLARNYQSSIIATGTGSGKTECFLFPILDYCFRHRKEPGIKAIIIYPMNALASDQAKRIAKLIYDNEKLRYTVTAGMYVGGYERFAAVSMTEDKIITDHKTMLDNPPDILLTNYKMLDYLLVRPKDAALWHNNQPGTLRYAAVDEMHTFDGAQGTDLACLLRRLKKRLGTPEHYLCSIGTSATLGTDEGIDSILNYASELFGELFEPDALITEDRLTPDEFYNDVPVSSCRLPAQDECSKLKECISLNNFADYLRKASLAWLDSDLTAETKRAELAKALCGHVFFRDLLAEINGHFCQIPELCEKLKDKYPALLAAQADVSPANAMPACAENTSTQQAAVSAPAITEHGQIALEAMIALISHARIGEPAHYRPFLNVHAQLWIRELRRLTANVSPKDIHFALMTELDSEKALQYLPVVNCSSCGATGWAARAEHGRVVLGDPETFYNEYFRGNEHITLIFPHDSNNIPNNMHNYHLCLNHQCFRLNDSPGCPDCGTATMEVVIPDSIKNVRRQNRYICPFCGEPSIALMGLRGTSAISVSLSQMFASRFNNDKKALAFSDSVQDSSFRAAVYNHRTWRSSLRASIQQFANNHPNLSLTEFGSKFCAEQSEKLTPEEFVSRFAAPNMTWMPAYEIMVRRRSFKRSEFNDKYIEKINNRLKHEIMLEYGQRSLYGRTLPKTGCSCLEFNTEHIVQAAQSASVSIANSLDLLRHCSYEQFIWMVCGILNTMRRCGAFQAEIFDKFLEDDGKSYLLSNDHINWLPGSGFMTIPRFPFTRNASADSFSGKSNFKYDNNFDSLASRKYASWIEKCAPYIDYFEASSQSKPILTIIFDELVKTGTLTKNEYAGRLIYAINPDNVRVSPKVCVMRCNMCGASLSCAQDNAELWDNAPCLRSNCQGRLSRYKDFSRYYGALYGQGDLFRINAFEHTGLLDRNDREKLEKDFRRMADRKPWDPNVLSCTPTLEMGVDIGDLSSVILCSLPKNQSQFFQRTGRAGRRDGNAFTLAVSAARPRDLYYYADPSDMLEGQVSPPHIFLKASAVLERQFTAFCMDCWIKNGAPVTSIPADLGICLNDFEHPSASVFPYNFIEFVHNNADTLLSEFLLMFGDAINEETIAELHHFAKGGRDSSSGVDEGRMDSGTGSASVEGMPGSTLPIALKMIKALNEMKDERKALYDIISELDDVLAELDKKPKDSSYEKDKENFRREKKAMQGLVKELSHKNVFNFLTDVGLLPNYAFPEEGVSLKAVIYKSEKDAEEQISGANSPDANVADNPDEAGNTNDDADTANDAGNTNEAYAGESNITSASEKLAHSPTLAMADSAPASALTSALASENANATAPDEEAQAMPASKIKARRKKKDDDIDVRKYSRGADAALGDFAPNNTFYAQGRRLTVNQIDMRSAKPQKWRLCPNCSYAQPEEFVKKTAKCPRCGSLGWADTGQLCTMLKASLVYANHTLRDTLVDDSSDDRSSLFYCREMLVDAEEKNILTAFRMDNNEFPFGYEFLSKAVIRDVNFGEKASASGNSTMLVNGRDTVRRGFKLCKYCGVIQPEDPQKPPRHAVSCRVRRSDKLEENACEEFMFLYREFSTEIMRLLIPAISSESSVVRAESFIAAFRMGLEKYFGNVDHLKFVVTDMPVDDCPARKLYLVVYDSVPGGTGYLKQLMHDENALCEIFSKALSGLEACQCKGTAEHDGCFHCLYAYKLGDKVGSLSKKTAISMLKAIISGKGNVEPIKTIGDIEVNSLFDSELERDFIVAMKKTVLKASKLNAAPANDSHSSSSADSQYYFAEKTMGDKVGYELSLNGHRWEIEPQVDLGEKEGLYLRCRPDFVLRPLDDDCCPVAVFTDGFSFHKDITDDDARKRNALIHSGKYWVWQLSWDDVQRALSGSYATMDILSYDKLPSGAKIYAKTVRSCGAESFRPAQYSAINLLAALLGGEVSLDSLTAHAKAWAISCLPLMHPPVPAEQMSMCKNMGKVFKAIDEEMPANPFCGLWKSDDDSLDVMACVGKEAIAKGIKADMKLVALLHSSANEFQKDWQSWLHLANLLQFASSFSMASDAML